MFGMYSVMYTTLEKQSVILSTFCLVVFFFFCGKEELLPYVFAVFSNLAETIGAPIEVSRNAARNVLLFRNISW